MLKILNNGQNLKGINVSVRKHLKKQKLIILMTLLMKDCKIKIASPFGDTSNQENILGLRHM